MSEEILHGTASWPGADACVSCTYTVSHGTSPGVAVFVMAAQPARPPAGEGQLRIEDDTGRVVRLEGCKIDKLEVNQNNTIWQLYIMDRRWKWAFGYISGTYNAVDDNKDLIKETIRSAYDLGVLILATMGEADASAEGLPTDQFPPVEWVAENPAQALETLAGQYGCHVVYRPSSNTVLIAQQGVGLGLPDDLPISRDNPAIDFPETPDSFVLVGAPTEYEMLLALEAVGKDADGEIKPIDELLYRPDGGWFNTIPGNYTQLKKILVNPKYEERTQDELDSAIKAAFEESYLKWYRIKMTFVGFGSGEGGPIEVPGYGKVLDRNQIIISDKRVTVATNVDGTLMQKPAEIRGWFHRARQLKVAAADQFFASTSSEKIDAAFTVEPAAGLVKFTDPVFIIQGSRTYPAQLVLRCAVQVRNPISFEVNRYTRILSSSDAPDTGPEVVRRPEVALKVIGNYTVIDVNLDPIFPPTIPPRWNLAGVSTNGGACDAVADLFLATAAAKYQREAAITRDYPGIIPIAPDGAITQITWRIGGGQPPLTTASVNTEHAHWLPPFEELRRLRFTRQIAKPAEPRGDAPPPGPGGSMYEKYGGPPPGSIKGSS